MVVDQFQGLTIIAAHMGGHLMWDEVEKHLVGRDLYFDTAYFLSDLTEQRFLSLLRAHGPEKVLFASDFPWLDPRANLARVILTNIDDSVKKKILRENAMHVYRIEAHNGLSSVI